MSNEIDPENGNMVELNADERPNVLGTMNLMGVPLIVKLEDYGTGHSEWASRIQVSYYSACMGYIGLADTLHALVVERGISPMRISAKHNVCSIGRSKKDNKWYGWSHRAIYGFGIGSKIRFGDCAFVPSNLEEFIRTWVAWHDNEYVSVTCDNLVYFGEDRTPEERTARLVGASESYIKLRIKYSDNAPNGLLHGMSKVERVYLPREWGRGEYTITTDEEAKQAAIDFAESVS